MRVCVSFVVDCKPFTKEEPQPIATHRYNAAVCHSSPFLDNLPALRRRFRQKRQPQIQVELFDELVAAMRGDCLKKGDEWHTAAMMVSMRVFLL